MFVYFVLDGPEMSAFDSVFASHDIRIGFLLHIHDFFSSLFSVIIVSDITIILISNNLYEYLLKLLQINVCLCVSVTEELLR